MVSDKSFYISHSKSSFKDFFLVNEFSCLEEVFEPFYDIYSNINNLRFKEKFSFLKSKSYYARVLACGLKEVMAKDIIIPKNLLLCNNHTILNLVSDKLIINAILKIDFRFFSF